MKEELNLVVIRNGILFANANGLLFGIKQLTESLFIVKEIRSKTDNKKIIEEIAFSKDLFGRFCEKEIFHERDIVGCKELRRNIESLSKMNLFAPYNLRVHDDLEERFMKWQDVRESRGLPSDFIPRLINAIRFYRDTSPSEWIKVPQNRLDNLTRGLESWSSNRKKKRLRTKDLAYCLRILNSYKVYCE